MRPFGRLAGRSILALSIIAALGLCWVKWGGAIKRHLVESMKSDASRVAEAAAAYEARDWERAAELIRPLLKDKADNLTCLKFNSLSESLAQSL